MTRLTETELNQPLPILSIGVNEGEGFLVVQQEDHPTFYVDLPPQSILFRTVAYLAGEGPRPLSASQSNRPYKQALSTLTERLNQPGYSPVIFSESDKRGHRAKLRAKLEICIEDKPMKEKTSSSLRWRDLTISPKEEFTPRTETENTLLRVLLDKLHSPRRVYFDDLARSLSFVKRIEPLQGPVYKVYLMTAIDLKTFFSNVTAKLRDEGENPKLREDGKI
jgi:hypothetical protein